MLGEVHWSAQQHRFIQELLARPTAAEEDRHIAIEAGNSLYQPIIDRYVGYEVSRDQGGLITSLAKQARATCN